jgi:hypothetical protein
VRLFLSLRPALGGLPCALGIAQPLLLPAKRGRPAGLRSPKRPCARQSSWAFAAVQVQLLGGVGDLIFPPGVRLFINSCFSLTFPCFQPPYPLLVSTIPAPSRHQTIHSTDVLHTLAPSPDQHLHSSFDYCLDQTIRTVRFRCYKSPSHQQYQIITDQHNTLLLHQSRTLRSFSIINTLHLTSHCQ